MREFIRKIGRFCEQHVEKIVLVGVGLVCIWLLFTRVIFSPNVVPYDKKSWSPSGIDPYIEQQARELKSRLGEPAQSKQVYASRLVGPVGPNDPVRVGVWGNLKGGFAGLLGSAINDIDANVSVPLPIYMLAGDGVKKEYHLPSIGEVKDVGVEYIRAVAYVPTQMVTEQAPYDKVAHEPNDIDLVTVEAKFDVADLYRRFYASFAGEDVREEIWRDPCLARPVFAAVQLQRQEFLGGGTWGGWQDVPRSNIDYHKRLFQIVEKAEELPPGGIKVRLLQFNDKQVMMDLLQPPAYQIASAKEEWFPPSLHAKFIDLQRKEDLETKRQETEKEKGKESRSTTTQRDQGRESRRGMLRDRSAGGAAGGLGGSGSMDEYMYGTGGQTRTPRRGQSDRLEGRTGTGGRVTDRTDRTRPGPRTGSRGERDIQSELYGTPEGRRVALGPSTADVYDEFNSILITQRTDLAKLKELLLFWAHDDTVEPGSTYRYRMRLGVFNPLAGTNQLAKGDEALRNQVILWSDFSGVTKAVEIPQTLYFFAKDVQETEKKVTVEVSRYALGSWRSMDFPVTTGELIGKVVEPEVPDPKRSRRVPGGPGLGSTSASIPTSSSGLAPGSRGVGGDVVAAAPETIDYRTGAVLLDLVEASDWRGEKSLRQRVYHDALYTFDGAKIEHMPVKADNWPKELYAVYQDIKKSQKQPQEPLRAWNTKLRGRTRGAEADLYDESAYEEMLRSMEEGQRY